MSDLVFHQVKLGAMANFVYVIGSRRTGECVLVDPAWDIPALLEYVEKEGLKVVGTLATHAHPDHVGGDIFGLSIPGLADLLSRVDVKVHANKHEAEWIRKVTGVSDTDIEKHEGGDVIELGDVRIHLLHTPGHTPGSQCFLVDERLVSGDTLFIQACGRVDLPGGNPAQMYESLTQRLAKLPADTLLFPGHDYADRPSSTIGDELRDNQYLRIKSVDDFIMLMGGGARGLT